MRDVRRGKGRVLACALAAALSLGGGFATATFAPTVAYAGTEEIRAVGEGVFKFNMGMDFVLTDDDDKPIRDAKGNELGVEMYGRGSAFLINEDTVLTCYHCASFSDDFFASLRELGYREDEVLKSMKYSVTVSGDVEIEATLVNWSKTEDWAIFKLSQTVGGSKPLVLRDSKTVQTAEPVWSVGFPADSDVFVVNTYRPEDVTVKSGTVNNTENIMDIQSPDAFGGVYKFRGNFLQTSVAMSGGDSGGPMVDENGYVVGINESGKDGYYYGVAIDSVTTVLDRLQIDYIKWTDSNPGRDPNPDPGSSPEPSDVSTSTPGTVTSVVEGGPYKLDFSELTAATSKVKEYEAKKDSYTAESYAALETAVRAGNDALNLSLSDENNEADYKDKQEQIKTAARNIETAITGLAEVQQSGLSLPLIIGIVAGAVALIGLIVALVVSNRKKAKAAAAVPPVVPPTQATPPATPPVVTPSPAPGTTVLGKDDGSTTVLDSDDSSTTVFAEAVNGGALVRLSNNERVNITRARLAIGRERSNVDYCIEGNRNIGRVHAYIIVRDGSTYVVDNNSTNGTYVNNVKVRNGEEVRLKNGDTVKLANEKFRYDA